MCNLLVYMCNPPDYTDYTVICQFTTCNPPVYERPLAEDTATFFIILVFNSLKSTTGLLFFVPFLDTSITGEVCVVLFLVKIPREPNFAI